MRTRTTCTLALGAAMALGVAASARADVTIGSTAPPAGSATDTCGVGHVIAQATDVPGTSYHVPGPGTLTAWQTNTLDTNPGTSVTLVVLHPNGVGASDVVAVDTETIPSPLPADGIARFTLAAPIAVAGGETLGLYNNADDATCYFDGGSTPAANTLAALDGSTPPAAGDALVALFENSPPGFRMNVAATVHIAQDAGVAATASSGATVGARAVLGAMVTNGGPASSPITFTDTVPAGLTIESAVAGSGSCTTAGQQVTCTISGLAPGQSAPVNIVVTPTAAKSYANSVSVAPPAGYTDSNSANNSASATLAVAGPPVAKCVVPSLKRTPLSTAKRVLKLLGCKVGKTRRAHSSSVGKGLVIKTSPKAGTYNAPKTVSLTVSSGPRKKKHK